MASFLTQCTGGCGGVVRTMTQPTEPVLCDSCRPGVKATEERVQRETDAGHARKAAKAERDARIAAEARAADKKARADAATKVAVKEPPKRPGRFSRKS